MATKECGFCKQMVDDEAKLCPDCGFDFEPKAPVTHSELSDAQLAALVGFDAARTDLAERKAGPNESQAKVAKMAKFLIVYIIAPGLIGLLMQRLHVFGATISADEIAKQIQQQRKATDDPSGLLSPTAPDPPAK